MTIKTDCWSLDISFYRWAAKRLTYFIEHEHGHPSAYAMEEWTAVLTEMRDTFQNAADKHETVWQSPSPRLRKAMRTWATELPHLWT